MTGTDPFGATPAGLYVHVPYCASLCSYCDFFRRASPAGVPQAFVEDILTELRLYAQDPAVRLDSVYFGGGTPSLLSDDQLARILGEVRSTFHLEGGAEVTLEANPETVDASRAGAWLGAGVNRLSLGAQSFDAEELEILGRRCAPERVRGAVREAAGAGFDDLSLDLMAGVPGQVEGSLSRSLDEALALPLTHASLYLLDLHRGTPLCDRIVRGELSPPGEEAAASLYELAHERMVRAGFDHYEISNFALPGRWCRHNLKYWRGGDYIGVGPSAHGRFRGWLAANPRSLEAWGEALARGEFPHEHRERITERRLLEDAVIFGLRLAEGVPFETVREVVGAEHLALRLGRLREGGYAEVEGERLRLTLNGFLLSNEVLEWLLGDLRA